MDGSTGALSVLKYTLAALAEVPAGAAIVVHTVHAAEAPAVAVGHTLILSLEARDHAVRSRLTGLTQVQGPLHTHIDGVTPRAHGATGESSGALRFTDLSALLAVAGGQTETRGAIVRLLTGAVIRDGIALAFVRDNVLFGRAGRVRLGHGDVRKRLVDICLHDLLRIVHVWRDVRFRSRV
jgi:hypothetical protein